MKTKSTKTWIIWCILQAICIGLAWAGVDGVVWAWNLYRFFAWMFCIIYILAVMGKMVGEPEITADRSVPGWLSLVTDGFVVGILASTGHFGYAALKAIEQFAEQLFYIKIKGTDES